MSDEVRYNIEIVKLDTSNLIESKQVLDGLILKRQFLHTNHYLLSIGSGKLEDYASAKQSKFMLKK